MFVVPCKTPPSHPLDLSFYILDTGSASGKKCLLNREVVPAFNNEFRWVLDINRENVCRCTSVGFGNIYSVAKDRNFDPIYIRCPSKVLDVDEAALSKTFSCLHPQ